MKAQFCSAPDLVGLTRHHLATVSRNAEAKILAATFSVEKTGGGRGDFDVVKTQVQFSQIRCFTEVTMDQPRCLN